MFKASAYLLYTNATIKINMYIIYIYFLQSCFSILQIKFLSNSKSAKDRTTYSKIAKNKGIDITLYWHAAAKSNFKIDINPLVNPQPKHRMPNMFLIGQSDCPKIFVAVNKMAKKAKPAHIECRLCFFLLDKLLYQRLSITVSESTG